MTHKYYSLLFLAGIIYTTAFAQPVIKAQGVAGGSGDEWFTSMYLTKDGGLIAGGRSNSNISGEKTENSRGSYDYWIIKYDSLHNIQWDKTIGGSDEDALNSLQQTRDGGYILGGYSTSNISGEKKENNKGSGDYWIVKLGHSGNIQWDKTIGGNDFDGFSSLQQTSDGGYIVGGYSRSNASKEKTENGRGYLDYWIVKLDKSGKIQWDKTIGGNGDDYLQSLQQTTDGGYILGGFSYSFVSGEKTEDPRGVGWDYWVVKLNREGKIEWDKTIGGSDADLLYSLEQTSDGGYVLGGISESNKSGEKTQNSRGYYDYWVVKLDNSGNIQWDKTIGGSDFDEFASLQQTSDGGYILGGNSWSNISGEKTENSRGSFDYWVVKLDCRGKIQWDKTIGGKGADGYGSVIVKEVGKNRYIVGGNSGGSGVTGDKKRPSRGGADFWLVGLFNKTGSRSFEVDEITNNIAAPDTNKKGLIAYPNPAKNSVSVNFTAQKNGKYIFEIINVSGNILLRKEANAIQGTNHTSIDVSRFAKGMYFMRVTKPDGRKETIQVGKE